ncbi:MAG: Holliday junction branch migration protein RuvA [Deltaproteobacteria bacterium]|nr:Holliday junction branch migration protein RuvA [Deltaproteobacteria bacterium]
MIAHVSGKLIFKSPESVVVDVGGVGYEVFIPLSTFYVLPEPFEIVALNIHTHLKEDAIQLYGFLTHEEKQVFKLLISVTGVGPKLARNILSGIAVADLVAAISGGNRARLAAIPGIGAKSAERLILELKDKVRELAAAYGKAAGAMPSKDAVGNDVISALDNLGYKSGQAEDALRKVRESLGAEAAFERLFKETLRLLSKR